MADSNATPITGVEIQVSDLSRSVTSTERGAFEITGLPSGPHKLLVRRVGFQPLTHDVTIRDGDTTEVLFRLEALPQTLAPIEVSEGAPNRRPGLRDMEERRRRGIGRFLSADELREIEGRTSLASILRRWGVTIQHGRGGALFALNPRGPTSFQKLDCPMQIVLDGIPLGAATSSSDLRNYSLQILGGIELYVGISQTPLIFERGDASCGVLVLWTRER